jgi:hypothetical protein
MIPETIREFGGKSYSIRFSARSAIEIEAAFGCKLKDLQGAIGAEPSTADLCRMARTCIRLDGKTLTEEQYYELIDAIDIKELGSILTDAMARAKGDAPGN